jgi:hypothetical protein
MRRFLTRILVDNPTLSCKSDYNSPIILIEDKQVLL